MNRGNENLMRLPIHQLEFSAEFIEKTGQLGFSCLEEIAVMGWARLLQLEHFNYHWFNELVSYLDHKQLLSCLEKPRPACLFPLPSR